MKFSELPMEFQEKLNKERENYKGLKINTGYEVLIYNETGTRYLHARRCCMAWSDNKGNAMPFGGGSYWKVVYGAIQFRATKNPLGGRTYEWCEGKQFSSRTREDGTVVEINHHIGTKKEVMELVKALGVFNI